LNFKCFLELVNDNGVGFEVKKTALALQ